jgi:imidazolonepropionase-like amidohydrolase
VNAELIGLQGEVGTLRAGAAADLIAVSGDPLANVGVLADPQRHLKLVVHDGRVIQNQIARSSL